MPTGGKPHRSLSPKYGGPAIRHHTTHTAPNTNTHDNTSTTPPLFREERHSTLMPATENNCTHRLRNATWSNHTPFQWCEVKESSAQGALLTMAPLSQFNTIRQTQELVSQYFNYVLAPSSPPFTMFPQLPSPSLTSLPRIRPCSLLPKARKHGHQLE